MSSTTQSSTDARITKDDLESKFQSLQDDLQGRASDKNNQSWPQLQLQARLSC